MLCPNCLNPSSRVAPGQDCARCGARCGWEAPPLPSYTLPQPGRETEAPWWTMALELPSGDTYRVTIPGSYDPKALAKGWRKVYEPEAPQLAPLRFFLSHANETLEAAANMLDGAASLRPRTNAEEAEQAHMRAAVATLRATASRWRSTAAPDSPDQE